MGPVRPTRDEALMLSAMVWAKRSTCSRGQVGAVIAREGRIISTGYNGAPVGMKHCDHTCNCGAKLKRDEGPTEHYGVCKTLQPCLESVHAEANAIIYAARFGAKTEGAELFTTTTPCPACARIIVNAGIIRVVGSQPYRDMSGWELLSSAGIDTMLLSVVE